MTLRAVTLRAERLASRAWSHTGSALCQSEISFQTVQENPELIGQQLGTGLGCKAWFQTGSVSGMWGRGACGRRCLV